MIIAPCKAGGKLKRIKIMNELDIIESVVRVFDMFDDIYGENDLITYRAFEHLATSSQSVAMRSPKAVEARRRSTARS